MNEEYLEYIEELEECLHKGMKLLQKAKQKMSFREGGYGNRFDGSMANPMMGGQMMPPMMGPIPMGGQMGFRENEMLERRGRDSMGRYTRG